MEVNMNKYIIVLAVLLVGANVEASKWLDNWNHNTNAPVVIPTNIPPVIVPSNNPPPVEADNCSAERVSYTGTKEKIATIGPSHDFRALVNDENHNGSWLTDLAVQHTRFDGNTMIVECFDYNGVRFHYLGIRQPSSTSQMIEGKSVVVSGNGTLREYWSSRKGSGNPPTPTNNPPPVVSGNTPDVSVKSGQLVFNDGWKAPASYPNQGGNSAKPGQFSGHLQGLTDQNAHYTMRGWFWSHGWNCAFYTTPDNHKVGCVIVQWKNGDSNTGVIDWRVSDK
jgi:hypothetical protein